MHYGKYDIELFLYMGITKEYKIPYGSLVQAPRRLI